MPSSHSSASMDWPQQRTWPTAASSTATTPGLEPAGSRETEKLDASPQREAAFRGGAATSSGNSHLPEEPMGSTVSFQSDRLPQQEASFRDWPSGGSLPEADPLDSLNHGESGQSESSHIPVDDSHQHDRMAASVLPIVQQEEQLLPQVVQQPPQQPRQLQQQLSGNPFSDTMPSPFASSSHEALEAGSVPDTSSGSIAHSHIMPENDFVPAAQAQQAGVVYGGDEDTMHAMPALQPVSQGELSSTPSLAQMLSDLHPAGKHRLMLSVVVQANEVSILGIVHDVTKSPHADHTKHIFLSYSKNMFTHISPASRLRHPHFLELCHQQQQRSCDGALPHVRTSKTKSSSFFPVSSSLCLRRVSSAALTAHNLPCTVLTALSTNRTTAICGSAAQNIADEVSCKPHLVQTDQ